MKAHDYSRRDWFVVLDDAGRLTLPSSSAEEDFVMGGVADETVLVAPGTSMPTRSALETIWRRRYETEAIVDLSRPVRW